MRVALSSFVLLAALLAGCPEEVDEPETPPGARRCVVIADCNEASCGLLKACVAGVCEAGDAGTVFVPCYDASIGLGDGAP